MSPNKIKLTSAKGFSAGSFIISYHEKTYQLDNQKEWFVIKLTFANESKMAKICRWKIDADSTFDHWIFTMIF